MAIVLNRVSFLTCICGVAAVRLGILFPCLKVLKTLALRRLIRTFLGMRIPILLNIVKVRTAMLEDLRAVPARLMSIVLKIVITAEALVNAYGFPCRILSNMVISGVFEDDVGMTLEDG